MAIKILAFVNKYYAYKCLFFIQKNSSLASNKIPSSIASFLP